MPDHQLTEEEIFEAAFKLRTPDSRLDYLTQVCRDDEQAERILALLEEGAPEASFLEHGPWSLQQNDSAPPRAIGDFEILGELGRGGMGIVYRARQRSLNREVALKVLSTGLGLTTKAVMRFKREAEAAAKLHHTNIVPIYSTGEENRIPYYTMELIDGPSLDQVIRQLLHESPSATGGSLDSMADSSGGSQPCVREWVERTLVFQIPQAAKRTSQTVARNVSSSSSPGTAAAFF